MSVYEAINAVMDDVRAVGKNDRNQQQNFNFRGIDAVVNALSPVMRKHGLTVRPSNVLSIEHIPFTAKSGGAGVSCRVVIEYTFSDVKGDSCTSIVAAEANDYGDKATPKAMSVAFRTCLLQAFALPTTETDPDAESYEHGEKPQATSGGTRQINRTPAVPEEKLQHYRNLIAKCQNKSDLLDLHTDAKGDGEPEQILAMIVAAGKKAAA
jgi:hypothetical protein